MSVEFGNKILILRVPTFGPFLKECSINRFILHSFRNGPNVGTLNRQITFRPVDIFPPQNHPPLSKTLMNAVYKKAYECSV